MLVFVIERKQKNNDTVTRPKAEQTEMPPFNIDISLTISLSMLMKIRSNTFNTYARLKGKDMLSPNGSQYSSL